MDAFCNIKASLRNIIWFPISGCLGDFFVISYQRKADQFQTIILWSTNSASGVIRLILKQPWSPTQVIGFCETVLCVGCGPKSDHSRVIYPWEEERCLLLNRWIPLKEPFKTFTFHCIVLHCCEADYCQ